MYAKPISFMVGRTNMYAHIFYQVYLLLYITTLSFKAQCCVIMVMLYLDYVSPQHLYQDMKKYVVIGLMNIYCIKLIENIINNSICIIFWRNICMVSIREEIIPNTPFQSPGPLLVILSVSSNVDFGDTSKVLLIVT